MRAAGPAWDRLAAAAGELRGHVRALKEGPRPILGYDMERALRAHKLDEGNSLLERHVRGLAERLAEEEAK